MDRQVLVDDLKKLEQELRKRHGPLVLLMLAAPDVSTEDDWNVVVSARGFNDKTRGEGLKELTDLLRQVISKKLWSTIKKATVLRTDDPFVNAVTTAFHTDGGVVDVQSCNIFGFEIPRALVFFSKKVPS